MRRQVFGFLAATSMAFASTAAVAQTPATPTVSSLRDAPSTIGEDALDGGSIILLIAALAAIIAGGVILADDDGDDLPTSP